MKSFIYTFLIFWSAFIIFGSGCSLTKDQKNKPNRIELAKDRKKKRDQLYQELNQNAIKQGTLTATIKEKFGEPDDVFKSGSSTGAFEVWTYDNMLISKEEKQDWASILLYFNDNRLISWKY